MRNNPKRNDKYNTEKGGYDKFSNVTYTPQSNFPLQNGYNNNTPDNRTNFPSNMYPPNGWQSPNPFGNFRPDTTNRQNIKKEKWSNFNKSFSPNNPIINQPDYSNPGNQLHDNMGPDLLDEFIQEYRIMIDSTDRDINKFKNQ